jgi:hypothetical protein
MDRESTRPIVQSCQRLTLHFIRVIRLIRSGAAAAPTPNGQRRGEQFGALALDDLQEPSRKRPQLRVLAAGIKFQDDKATAEIFRDGQAVARNSNEGGLIEMRHARLTENADTGRAFGHDRAQRVTAQHLAVDVIHDQAGPALDQFGDDPLVHFVFVVAGRKRPPAGAVRRHIRCAN